MRYRGMLLKERYADVMVLRALERAKTHNWSVKNAAKDIRKPKWTAISFEVDSPNGEDVIRIFTELLKTPDWFMRLSNDDWNLVVFRDKTFKYPKGDSRGKSEAVEYARSMKVPDLLLEWKE